MVTGQPYLRLIMTWGGGRSEIHKQLFVNNDLLSLELLLLLFREHLQGDIYQSRLLLWARLGGDFCRGWNPRKRIMKSANQWWRILEPEKTCSSSSPLFSLFIMYLSVEPINVLLNHQHFSWSKTGKILRIKPVHLQHFLPFCFLQLNILRENKTKSC